MARNLKPPKDFEPPLYNFFEVLSDIEEIEEIEQKTERYSNPELVKSQSGKALSKSTSLDKDTMEQIAKHYTPQTIQKFEDHLKLVESLDMPCVLELSDEDLR